MYKLTRKEASELLNMSTRSIDRYIKSGKIRIKKD
jgi:predicted site-specific integrase-resolvase